ncbi:MAG: M48 family metallopeptidase, partial [Helicobacter sp.]|nr:M48 family metallopeptidase [Helicobacter sp.]
MEKIILTLLIFIFGACSSAYYTNRSQLILISESKEKALGEQSAKEILKQSRLSKNIRQRKMVERVGANIAKVSGREDFAWEFYLLEDAQYNAFCLPGGKVFVYSGLMEIISNDDELAVVLSHEIAHVLLRHGAERMSVQMITQFGGNILGSVVGAGNAMAQNVFSQVYGVGSNLGIILPFSRSHETEADRLGIFLMSKAGYNPQSTIIFWEKMSQKGEDGVEFLSTHPSNE